MIELHQYPISKNALVPNYSPFCAKLECYLKAAEVPYKTIWFKGNPASAPKGKLPFIVDNGQAIADSELIIKYLKENHQIDLDSELTPFEKAQACAFKKMMEDHLAWVMIQCRWVDQDNWEKTKPAFFRHLPPILNQIIPALVRKGVAKSTWAQGMGRHDKFDLLNFADEDLSALSEFLGDKSFFFGDGITSLDTTVYGLLVNILKTELTPELKDLVSKYPNLVSHTERITQKYFIKN